MRNVKSDVLIIGSGFGGAAPALRLARAGLDVLMTEKGPSVDPRRDYRQTQDPKYLLKYLKGLGGDGLSFTYAEALGGGSPFYEMVSLRAPSMAFAQVDAEGHRLWPTRISRKTLDPHYRIAEEMLRVEQVAPNDVPKTGLVFSLMMKQLGYTCDRVPYAARGCIGSGFCITGCIYGAKQSLLRNYIPQAVAAGARIETDLEAVAIRLRDSIVVGEGGGSLPDLPYRYDVILEGRNHRRERIKVSTKLLILAGGTVGTARLLLNSKEHLPRLSSHVGRNIAFNGSVKVAGLLGEDMPDVDMFVGRSHPGVMSYQFLESHGITVTAAKPLPIQAVAAARLSLDGDARTPAYWGQAHVDLMQQYRHRMMVLAAFGFPPATGSLSMNSPFHTEVHLERTPALREYYDRTKRLLESILTRNGCRLVRADFVNGEGAPHEDLHFSTAHHVGSCRMADSPVRGVTDVDGEVFGYPGMFVTDGAAIPTSLAVNTSLTILANAERIAERLCDRYGRVATRAATADSGSGREVLA